MDTEADRALAALNAALAARCDDRLSPQPDPILAKVLGRKVFEAMEAAAKAGLDLDFVEVEAGRWVAIRAA